MRRACRSARLALVLVRAGLTQPLLYVMSALIFFTAYADAFGLLAAVLRGSVSLWEAQFFLLNHFKLMVFVYAPAFLLYNGFTRGLERPDLAYLARCSSQAFCRARTLCILFQAALCVLALLAGSGVMLAGAGAGLRNAWAHPGLLPIGAPFLAQSIIARLTPALAALLQAALLSAYLFFLGMLHWTGSMLLPSSAAAWSLPFLFHIAVCLLYAQKARALPFSLFELADYLPEQIGARLILLLALAAAVYILYRLAQRGVKRCAGRL